MIVRYRNLVFSLFIFIIMLILTTAAFGENTDNNLFPLCGVTLGKTTTDELAQLGSKSEQYNYYIINSLKFWVKNNIASSVLLTRGYENMPEQWRNLGFAWELSYDEWITLLRNLGFQVRITKFPIVKITGYQYTISYNPYQTFEAEFDALKKSEYPTVLEFKFNYSRGTKTTSKGTLSSIKATFQLKTTELVTQDYYENKEEVTLPDKKRKAIAYSGILAELNNEYHERLSTIDITPDLVQKCKDLLLRDWGIKSREDLLKTLDSLDKEGHSLRYKEIINILDENPSLYEEVIAQKHNYDDNIVKRLFFVRRMRNDIGDRTLRAWDYGRLIYLCRDGYAIGFLSEKEAWERIEKTAAKIEKLYYSWEDYGASYIIGRMFWATANNDEIDRGNWASVAMSKLMYTKNSAWNLPWDNKSSKKKSCRPLTIEDALYCPSKEHHAWELLTEGRKLLQNKLPDKALIEFNNIIKLKPRFYNTIYLYRGNAYFAKGDYRKAISDYQRFLKDKPKDYYASLYIAEAFEKNNQPDEALSHYQEVITIDPKNPDGYISLGRFYFTRKQYQDTILTLEKVENLLTDQQTNSNNRINELLNYTLYLLGAGYYNLHFYDQALPYFLRAYEYYKSWSDLNYYIGICYLNKFVPENNQAIEYFKRAEILGEKLPQEIVDLINK